MDINIAELDIFDDCVEHLTEQEEDKLLEREKHWAILNKPPVFPCECYLCMNWIDITELYCIIGFKYDKIACLSCGTYDEKGIIMKHMKFKLLAFFYVTELDDDVTFTDEIDINCEDHVAFTEFLADIHSKGHIGILDKQYGDHSHSTTFPYPDHIVEELAIYVPITEDEFNMLFQKWKALLKQGGLL